MKSICSIENLTNESVNIIIKQIDQIDSVDGNENETITEAIVNVKKWRTCLANDENGRADLTRVLSEFPAQLADVMSVWGDTPIVSYEAETEPEEQLTPEQQRERAYQSLAIVPWPDENTLLTVDAANAQCVAYICEGEAKLEVVGALNALIHKAKEQIRAEYPDVG